MKSKTVWTKLCDDFFSTNWYEIEWQPGSLGSIGMNFPDTISHTTKEPCDIMLRKKDKSQV